MRFSVEKFGFAVLLLFSLAICASLAATPKDIVLKQCMCGRDYTPVCGSDSKTYSNRCLFDCVRKQLQAKGRSLTLARSGACEAERSMAVDAEVAIPGEEETAAEDEGNDCACDRSYAPLCGSDLRTYANPCVFDCRRKKLARMGSVLTVLREGICN